MSQTADELYAQEYFDYLKNRGVIRKFVRKLYLNDIRKYCKGKTIDFGCGVGQLLSMLPKGSVGYEVNKIAVDYCNAQGLHVEYYDPQADNYRFEMIPQNVYTTFTMNHVLEHIADSQETIKKIFESCNRLGIKRIVFTVPGVKGFKLDKTHETFIDKNYLADNGLLANKYYKLKVSKYFPINWKRFSHYFTHNELRLVFNSSNE